MPGHGVLRRDGRRRRPERRRERARGARAVDAHRPGEVVVRVVGDVAAEEEVVVVVGQVVGVQVRDEDVAQPGEQQAGVEVLRGAAAAGVDDVVPPAHRQGRGDAGAHVVGRRPAGGAEQRQPRALGLVGLDGQHRTARGPPAVVSRPGLGAAEPGEPGGRGRGRRADQRAPGDPRGRRLHPLLLRRTRAQDAREWTTYPTRGIVACESHVQGCPRANNRRSRRWGRWATRIAKPSCAC